MNKDLMFKLSSDLVKITNDEVRQAIIRLTSILNQKKDDSYYIPRNLCDVSSSINNTHLCFDDRTVIYNTFIKNVDDLSKFMKKSIFEKKEFLLALLSEYRDFALDDRAEFLFSSNDFLDYLIDKNYKLSNNYRFNKVKENVLNNVKYKLETIKDNIEQGRKRKTEKLIYNKLASINKDK